MGKSDSIHSRLAQTLWVGVCLGLTGCGDKIGDSCGQSLDCSQDGDRICDTTSPGGYCTVQGCDYNTCPEESVCVRFYPVSLLSKSCKSEQQCTLDEVCTAGKCAPRVTERRFCMLKCSGQGDCRDRYECRDSARMRLHGGERVLGPNDDEDKIVKFCAPNRPCETLACDFDDVCQGEGREAYCSAE